MKKILCLILALCCVFSIVSCDGGEEETVDPDKAFFDVVAASRATQIKTLTYYIIEGEDPFNGSYETSVKANGDFTFTYSFTRIATLEDSDNPDVTIDGNRATLSGVIKFENGKYYNAKNGEVLPGVPAVSENHPKLNLSKEKLGEYEINDAKTKLTTTLTAEAAAELLGMEIDATSDVVVEISTNGTYLTRVLVTYDKGSAKVRIDTSYS